MAAARQLRAELTDPAPVMDAAAGFLAVRPRSEAETRRRLLRLGYPEQLVDEVLTRLTEMGYLDDEQFARAWVESRDRARPRGTIALRRELALKGIARPVIDAVLEERERAAAPGADADGDAATALLARRRAALDRIPDPVKRRQRAYAFLARNGFDPETCRAVSATLTAARAE